MQGQQNKKATFLRYGMMVFIYYNIFKASGALLWKIGFLHDPNLWWSMK